MCSACRHREEQGSLPAAASYTEPPSLPESRVVPPDDPSRVQPSRRRQRPDLFAYHVHVGSDELRSADLDMATKRLSSRPTVRAYLQLISDDTGLACPFDDEDEIQEA